MVQITSPQNPRVKRVARLTASRRLRERERLTVVEGRREVRRFLDAGLLPVEAYICPERLDPQDRDLVDRLQALAREQGILLAWVGPEAFARMAYREESSGLVLVVPYWVRPLAEMAVRDPAFLAVVESPEKPGNLGAILRSADGAGVDGLILCGTGTDVHNPNVVRASLGTCFAVATAQASTPEAIQWLQERGIRIVAATPQGAIRYTQADYRGPVAMVTGSEAHGLSPAWLQAADLRVYIPMHGVADSLNLAISTALLLYEVVRQREG